MRELREETGLEAEVRPLDSPFGYEGVHVESFIVDVPPDWEPTLDWEHDEYRWLPREEAAAAPLLSRAGRAPAESAVTELWHFSEDPSLGHFAPRDGKVWAIDGPHSWLYWFPRDCPRACFWAVEVDDGRGRGAMARRRPRASRRA